MAADEDRRVETRGQPPRTSEAFDEQEPPLEEILSSIRNIVSAGGAAGEPLTPDPASDEDGSRTPASTERRDRSGETADAPPGEQPGGAPDEIEALTARLDRDEDSEAPADTEDPGAEPDAMEALTAQLDRDEDGETPADTGYPGAEPDAMEALTAQLDRDEDGEAPADAADPGAEPGAAAAPTVEPEAAPAERPERSEPPVTVAEEPDMTPEAPSAPADPAAEAPQQSAAQSHTPLVSPAAEAASVGALAALIAEERRIGPDGASAAGDGRTVEQVAEDLLRPMLREWLDDNLPSLVARIVEAEVRRLSARLGR